MNKTSRSNSFSKTNDQKVMEFQKKEKLKKLLIAKFINKFNLKFEIPEISREIDNFMKGDKIKKIVDQKNKINTLKETLSQKLSQEESPEEKNNENQSQMDRNESQMDVMSMRSGYSNFSKKSKNDELELKAFQNMDDETYSKYSERMKKKPEINENQDLWNEIAEYNQKMFQKDKIMAREKDREVKQKTKQDLENQVTQKKEKITVEKKEKVEDKKQVINYVNFLTAKEMEKFEEIKQKVLNEKESRDKQMREEKKRKWQENKEDREYEKRLS